MSSLRRRLAVLVAGASFCALSVAGFAIVSVVDHRMHESIREEAIRAAEQGRAALEAGVDIYAVGTSEPGGPLVEVEIDGESNNDSSVVLGKDNPLDDERPTDPSGVTVVRRDVGDTPTYTAFLTDEGPDGRPYTVVAAAPLTETERTLSALRTSTITAVPTVSILLGWMASAIARRALRPVDLMRLEADEISHGTLHRRLTPSTRASELAQLADTMNDMLDRLDRAAQSQRQLVSDVSHELRNPLTTIRGIVELALRERGSDDDAARTALGEVDRLEVLVRDLLMLSRLNEARHSSPEDVDLDDIVSSIATALGRPGCVIDLANVGHARVRGDRNAFEGLVRNLINNAVRHASTLVRVTLTSTDDAVCLTVEDDGPGIPLEQRHFVFERFTRLDEGRSRDAGGAGLGLAVVDAATRAHGGTITIEDSELGGARFVVIVPSRDVGQPRNR